MAWKNSLSVTVAMARGCDSELTRLPHMVHLNQFCMGFRPLPCHIRQKGTYNEFLLQ